MANGLFILLSDDKSLQTCLNYGVYGFLMPPVMEDFPNSRSRHYAILSDYACCETGTEIFFFNNRRITYGGKITATNGDNPIFFLNGDTSPLGRKAKSEMYVDMGSREEYKPTGKKGVYDIGVNQRGEQRLRSIPFIIEFDNSYDLCGKQIISDELYFELGNYNYPFPSNSIQNRGFCTLTPKETNILLNLLKKSEMKLTKDYSVIGTTKVDNTKKKLFNKDLLNEDEIINESHLEFLLLADSEKLDEIIFKCLPDIPKDNYIRCRQVPLCPFRPIQFDLADICLYSKKYPIKENTLPNIVIELKNKPAGTKEYKQVTKYLRWIKQISSSEFDKIRAILIAPRFSNNLTYDNLVEKDISIEYKDKIILYSFDEDKVVEIN